MNDQGFPFEQEENKPVEAPQTPYFSRSTYVPQPPVEPQAPSVPADNSFYYRAPENNMAAPMGGEDAPVPANPDVPFREMQPVSPVYNHVQPAQEMRWIPPQPRPQPKKKRSMTGRIVALALVCALLGGVCGGAIVAFLRSSADKNPVSQPSRTQSTQYKNPPAPYVEVNNTDRLTPAQVYENNVAAVVGIANEGTSYNIFGQASKTASSGSGFIISADGEILTNYHVINGAQTLTVTMIDGSTYSARVLGYEAESDVALLKIDAQDLPVAAMGNSDALYVGDEVAAIGNPLGELTYSLTVGYISSMDRDVNTDGTPINMMQIDAAINPGNSGGPLFDMYGNVIGINTAKYSGTSGSGTTIEGIGFAIPINDVKLILDDLRENGKVLNRAYIGISVQTVAASDAMGTPAGAKVLSVERGSCGDDADLQSGDIITAVDDVEVLSQQDLSKQLKKFRAGDSVTLTVYRDGRVLTLTAVFDSKPTQEAPEEEPTEQPTAFNPWSFFFP